MALQFVQAASNFTNVNTSVAAVSCPALTNDGDFLVMAVATVIPSDVSATPAGWTLLTAGAAGVMWNGLNARIYWKQASSEPASYSANFNDVDKYSIAVIALRGQAGSSSAIDAVATDLSTSANATPTVNIPSIISTANNDLQLGIAFELGNTTYPQEWIVPAGWTIATQITACYASHVTAYCTLTASGTAAATAFSVSAAAGYSPWITFSIAIVESAGAAGSALTYSMCLLGVGA